MSLSSSHTIEQRNSIIDVEDVDPGLVDHRINSSTSLHSMDDDLHPQLDLQKETKININGHHDISQETPLKKIFQRCKNECCII